MAGKATVKVIRLTDRGLRSAVKKLFGLQRASVKVGVFGDKGDAQETGSSLTVSEIAAVHEFGLGVPERSWLRGYIDENQESIARAALLIMTKTLARVVASGKPVSPGVQRGALAKLGMFMVAGIQERMTAGIAPELAQSTIDRKGSSTPLINTGQLRASVTYEVDLDGSVSKGVET
jgi:hypothetical protein